MNSSKIKVFFSVFAVCTLLCGSGFAATLPFLSPVFGEHMVLQRGKLNSIWGWTTPGEQVTVTLNGIAVTTTAGSDGRWQVSVQPPAAGGPYTMTIDGSQHLSFTDILVGDVWICGGQSNMQFGMGMVTNSAAEVLAATNSNIRLFMPTPTAAYAPASVPSSEEAWTVCTPQSIVQYGWSGFSAVGYYFAKNIQQNTGVPIGMVEAALGGTRAETWVSTNGLQGFPEFSSTLALEAQVHATNGLEYGNPIWHWFDQYDQYENSWFSSNLDYSNWQLVTTTNAFAQLGVPYTPSICYFRKTVVLPNPLPSGDAYLQLGNIEMMDTVKINGVSIGSTAGSGYSRNYTVGSWLGALQPGTNTIVVRILKTATNGGFESPASAMQLVLGDQSVIPLDGYWEGRLSLDASAVPLPTDYSMYPPIMASVLYNGTLAPEVPMAMTGAIWYQGEANVGSSTEYQQLLPALIADWRRNFGQGDFPFYIVSLANLYAHNTNPNAVVDEWTKIREAQIMAATSVTNSGVAITVDVGDPNNLHPTNKKPVGDRLAAIALSQYYGQTNVVYSGPQYQSATPLGGGALRLSFTHTDGGLAVNGSTLGEFSVSDKNGVWYWASATIDTNSNTITVSSSQVSDPVAVRYAWQDNPDATLINGAGLPAVPFYAIRSSSSTNAPYIDTTKGGAFSNFSQTPLVWSAVSGAVSYTIQRSTNVSGPFTTIASGVSATTYNDLSATTGVAYYYKIIAIGADGHSIISAEVGAAVPAVYLPFDENSGNIASDISGNGWNGTLMNGSTWGGGKYGNAISLSGNTNYVSLPNGIVSNMTSFTMSVWVNPSNTNAWARIMDFGTGTNYMYLTQNAGTGPLFGIYAQGATYEQDIVAPTLLPTNTWSQIAVTLSGSVGILYVNGVPVATNNYMTLNPASLGVTTNNYLGKSEFSWNPYFAGSLDDFRIYNQALSPAAIAYYYSHGPIAVSSLQAYLPMDSTNGAIAADTSGNGWNATLVNNPALSNGIYGNAINLDGASNYMTLGSGVVTGLTNFTVASWVNPANTNAWSRIFDFGTGTDNYMFLTQNSGTGLRFAIRTQSVEEQAIQVTSLLPTNTWSHVAVTLSGTVGIFYINGVPVGTNNSMTLNPASLGVTTSNYLGKSQFPWDPYLSAAVDDFRIYNTTLAASDIALLASQTQIKPQLGTFTLPVSVPFGTPSFGLTAPSSTSAGAFTYSSSQTNIASINGNVVTINGAGTTTITASQLPYGIYPGISTNVPLVVTKGTQSISFPALSNMVYSNGSILNMTATASSGLPVSFSSPSTNISVLLYAVNVWGGGSATIVASQSGNSNYFPAPSVTNTFLITPASNVIAAFSPIPNQVYSSGLTLNITPPTSSSGRPVIVSVVAGPAIYSSNTLTILGIGTVTLAANQAGSSNYAAAPQVTTSFQVSSLYGTNFGTTVPSTLSLGGIPSLTVYALGGSTTTFDPRLEPTVSKTNSTLTLKYTARTNDPYLSIMAETSTNLLSTNAWSTSGITTSILGATNIGGVSLASCQVAVAYTTNTRRFLRLRTTLSSNAIAGATTNTSTVSDPVGVYCQVLPASSDTFVALPFTVAPLYRGVVTGATNLTITVDPEAGGWNNNQFTASPCYVQALNGSQAGVIFDVATNSSNTITLANNGLLPSGYTSGTLFKVIPYSSIASILPVNDQDISFTASASTNTSVRRTQLLLPNLTGQGINRGFSSTNYFLTNSGWVNASNAVSVANTLLMPDTYFVVRNPSNSATNLMLSVVGNVHNAPMAQQVDVLTIQQDNPVAQSRAADITLNSLGLTSSGAFLPSSSTMASARKDQLLTYNNSTIATNKSPSAIYYYLSNSTTQGWRSTASTTVDAGTNLIPPASALIIRKATNATPSSLFWTNAIQISP